MNISIREVKGQKRVYYGRKLVGTLRKFCCGIDFRPKDRPNALFSILSVKYGTIELTKCLEALMTVKIPKKCFHWNFRYGTAKDEIKMDEFRVRLSIIK